MIGSVALDCAPGVAGFLATAGPAYFKHRVLKRARATRRPVHFDGRPVQVATGPLPVEIPNWPPKIDPPSSDPFWDAVVGVDVNDWIAAKTPESFAELLRRRAAKPARKGRTVSAAQQRWRDFLRDNPYVGESRDVTEIYTEESHEPIRRTYGSVQGELRPLTNPELDWLLKRKDVR